MDEKYPELAVKVENASVKIGEQDRRIKTCEDDIKDLKGEQKVIYKLVNSVENLTNSMMQLRTQLREDISEVKSGQDALTTKVTEIENRPAKETKRFMDNIKEKAWWVFIGGIIVTILYQILPNFKW
ncbi:hypothetical protein SAMN05443270_3015 [Lacrimispora sphenoides]|uniref:hypothetical protein n=1 Tax=Lacrimispora sphenoides TaxID=29370 RepID=UPI0008B7386D|nr:hypothetical protein [Lacrimispora sphenoides]SEU08315.1 hypothetical protein SAMN05443270_3015 [Lacrimispora sphenoides]